MRLLWVTTKPPWPPTDGGRLVAALTLEALARAGHDVEVFAPALGASVPHQAAADAGCALRAVAAAPRPLWHAAPRALFTRAAVSIVRHTLPAVRAAVARRLAAAPAVDVVVAEQLQALAQCGPAFGRALPVVLRAQNVESDLWAAAAGARPWLHPLLRYEAARLAADEGAAVRRVAATVALTGGDAARLRRLAERAGRAPAPPVVAVPAPFPARWPSAGEALQGVPAVVLFGSAGWRPNAAGAAWFVEHVWPAVHTALPEARLHAFGTPSTGAAGVVAHAAPADSRAAFAPGSVLVVPLHMASGVRVRILEAWARGVPVVATPQAVAGLEAEHGRELLVARDAIEFVQALRRLAAEPALAAALVAAGRARLAATHAPERVAARLTELFAALPPGRRVRGLGELELPAQ